jgi:hypothetical protein
VNTFAQLLMTRALAAAEYRGLLATPNCSSIPGSVSEFAVTKKAESKFKFRGRVGEFLFELECRAAEASTFTLTWTREGEGTPEGPESELAVGESDSGTEPVVVLVPSESTAEPTEQVSSEI